ncbi:hypothetical protein T10_13447 [Trichinella papuae]|uniref:Uncharacterized protein n=1 Tax=Trichinella papuae TaxID=268474 RepID=A0A0V1M183_9BILA|nr:hypothetical protein T10_13447 [Trichinella papuae]
MCTSYCQWQYKYDGCSAAVVDLSVVRSFNCLAIVDRYCNRTTTINCCISFLILYFTMDCEASASGRGYTPQIEWVFRYPVQAQLSGAPASQHYLQVPKVTWGVGLTSSSTRQHALDSAVSEEREAVVRWVEKTSTSQMSAGGSSV